MDKTSHSSGTAIARLLGTCAVALVTVASGCSQRSVKPIVTNRTREVAPAIVSTSSPLVIANQGGPVRSLPPFDSRTFSATVRDSMRKHRVPGAAVVVVQGDRVIMSRGFGMRSTESRERVDEETRFQAASVTKLFVALAAASQVGDARLEWDRPVVDYLPSFRMRDQRAGREATVRDFLAHRSGLKSDDGDLLGRLYGPDEALRRVRYLRPGAAFRAKPQYSNVGYLVVGEALARRGGVWQDAVFSRVFVPLGMERSGPNSALMGEDGNASDAHSLDGGAVKRIPRERAAITAGGDAVTTGRDMGRMLRMLLNGGRLGSRQIIDAEELAQVYRPVIEGPVASIPNPDPDQANALGCEVFEYEGTRVICKNGALMGQRSIVVLIPEKRIGLAVLSNLNLSVFPEAVGAAFLEQALGPSKEDLVRRVEAAQPVWDAMQDAPSAPADAEPSPVRLDAYGGEYDSPLYGRLVVGPVDARSDSAAISVGPTAFSGRMRRLSESTFWMSFPNPDDTAGIVTFTVKNGRATGIQSATFGPFKRR